MTPQRRAGPIDVVFFLPAAIGFCLSVIVFGVLMVRGGMPTWLGGVWVICGVMFWIGILPLWFFLAALVFGVWGLVRIRPGRFDPDRVAALPVSTDRDPATT